MPLRHRSYPRTRDDKTMRHPARGSTYDIERRERQRVYAGEWRDRKDAEARANRATAPDGTPKPRAHS